MLALAVAALLRVAGLWFLADAHPLHSTLVEIEYQPESKSAVIRVRAFSDDLTAAVAVASDSSASDSALSGYIRGTLALVDSAKRPIPLRWQGAQQTGDMMLLQLRARLEGGLSHAGVLSALLWERFPDQVNIVRASYGGRTEALLFSRGDLAKTFP